MRIAWILDGATVHVSMIGFDDGTDPTHELNGRRVQAINPDLTATADLTKAQVLSENAAICFRSDEKGGPFDIESDLAQNACSTGKSNGRPNMDVVRPYYNARDITQQYAGKWIIDFGYDTSLEDAALYEMPFEYVRRVVKPVRDKSRNEMEKTIGGSIDDQRQICDVR